MAASVIDAVSTGPALEELESLVKEITIQVLDRMKDVVSVKKWALPDEQNGRPTMPWESSDQDQRES